VSEHADQPGVATAPAGPPTPQDTGAAGSPSEAAGAASGGQAVETPAWQQAIDQAAAEELRKHPKVAGIVGDMVDKAIRNWERTQHERITAAQRQQAERELEEMAQSDPLGFSRRFLSDKEQDRLQRQFQTLRESTREEFARYVGAAYRGVPEWAELTPADYESLARAVAGKGDDEVIAAYNARALEIIADKRAEKRASERHQKWRSSELETEVEARIKERQAQALQRQRAPSVARPAGPGAPFDPTKLDDKAFREWYEGPDGPLARV